MSGRNKVLVKRVISTSTQLPHFFSTDDLKYENDARKLDRGNKSSPDKSFRSKCIIVSNSGMDWISGTNLQLCLAGESYIDFRTRSDSPCRRL